MSLNAMERPRSNIFTSENAYTRLVRLVHLLDRLRGPEVALVFVLLVAAWLRFNGLNWDSNHHLHPDERFLSTLTNDLKWPNNLDNYFDPTVSRLSPYSIPNMGMFVYGTLPIYVDKLTAILLNADNYDRLTVVGRMMSGVFDLGAIFFLYLIGRRLYGKKVGLLSAVLLAFSVLNIQLSHFYTVDTFASFFVLATIYFLLRASTTGRWIEYAITGLVFGLGLASKISVVTLLAPILVGAGLDLYRRARNAGLRAALEPTLVRLLTVLAIAALTFRVVQPIAFTGPSFLNWSLNPRWLHDINEQQATLTGDADLPWVQQWTDRPATFALYNMVVWGMGVPLGLASLAGLGLVSFELVARRKLHHLLPLVYVLVTFIYHSATFVKFMRYFLPIYPFLILMAAYLIAQLWRKARASRENAPETLGPEASGARLKRLFNNKRLAQQLTVGVAAVVILGTLFYAIAFSAIYGRVNSRIVASRWIYQNIPAGATLANEHWDDWLPVGGVDGKTAYGDAGAVKSVEMRNYEDDTPAKLEQLVRNLTRADYVVLSSNRLYDSIPRLPMRYPMTSRYYQLLFKGDLGFERVAEFTSYPTLFGIQFPDQVAEESFSVYDHPRVQIFKKTAQFDPKIVSDKLGQGVSWEAVQHLTPRQASAAPKALRLSASEQILYENAAIESSSEVNEESWGSGLPVLAWFIVLQLIGLLALPITLMAFGRLADRGYLFSKAIGLLIVAWGAWLIASVRLAPFTWWAILAVMALCALGSLAIARRSWRELSEFVRTHWRLLLVEELLFWIFFAFLLIVRLGNSDLWHPAMGGEKPMDLAYLTAIVHTPYFPAYDPWFAGGYINYYYFGYVLVATLIHLTGLVPYVAYNLAVPTFFAMTAVGGFAVAFNFVESRQTSYEADDKHWLGIARAALIAGACGALFVAVFGNLAQVQLLWDGLRKLSAVSTDGNASPLVAVAEFANGMAKWLGGRKIELPTEWWYWNATRVIPGGKGEAGPINEMPFFTFLFGDLHAHMMTLPYTLLVLGLALNLIRDTARATFIEGTRSWRLDPAGIFTLVLLALTTGALWPMNTWDFPTYTVIAAAAIACREYARRGCIDMRGLWAVAWRIALILVVGRLLFLPFHQNYASDALGAELWAGSRTPLVAYLVIHGFFLFVLVSYLVAELLNGQGHNAIVRSLRLYLRYWRHRARMRRRFDLLTRSTSGYRYAIRISKVLFVLVLMIFAIRSVVGLALALNLLTAFLLFSPRPNPRRQFVLCMIGLGLMLTALVEIVVIKGDISRMNTVFKFYLQVWVLWAVAAAGLVPELTARLKREARQKNAPAIEPPEGSSWTPEIAALAESQRRAPNRTPGRAWRWALGVLFAACLLYPITATPARMSDRFQDSVAVTLDGSAYMRTSVYIDQGQPILLDWDRQAIAWLRDNVRGMPTIVEANTPLYRWGSRVSIYTGLPTVIGWDWHQRQQRSILPGLTVERRIADVRTIYSGTDLNETKRLLDQYRVRYIYIGPLERLYYDANGLDKFERENKHLWNLVYQNEQVKIFEVSTGLLAVSNSKAAP